MLLFVAVVGFILSQVDYVLVIRGNKLPVVDGAVAIALLVLGVFFFGIGYLLARKGAANEPVKPEIKLDMNNLDFIVRSIKKTGRRNLIIGIFLLAFGVAMFCVPFANGEGVSGAGNIFMLVFGLIMMFIATVAIYQFVKVSNVTESKIYKLLMLEPQHVTALHIAVFSSQINKSINASIIADKKTISVLQVSEKELELLKQYLLKHNPGIEITQTGQQVS